MSLDGYTQTFMEKNKIKYDEDKMLKRALECQKRTNEIIVDIFEAKYGCKMSDSPFGRLLMGSYNYMSANEIDFDKPFYHLKFADTNSIGVSATSIKHGISYMIIDARGDDEKCYINNAELQSELASMLGVNNLVVSEWYWRDQEHVVVTIQNIEYIIDINQLNDFDYREKYEEFKEKVNEHNKTIQLRERHEDER